jgi:lia operon protein LiaG
VLEGGGDTVEAWFHGTVNSSNPDAIPRLVAERRGSAIDIRLERKRRWNLGWHWGTLALEVTVPKGYAGKVSAKGVSAKIELADHAFGGLSLSTVSGEVSLGTVRTSDFEMHTTSGRFRAAGVMAERSELSSISGEMEVKSLSGILRAHSVSGEVSLGFVSTPAFADVTSTSGEVSLRLPANAGFQLDARSTSGQVTCDFPIQISESQSGGGRHALAGTVGGGTNSIKVRTVSGTIRVQR